MTRDDRGSRDDIRLSRVLAPHKAWQGLDFVLATIALLLLGFGLWGASTAVNAFGDMRALAASCGAGQCDHRGSLTAHAKERGSSNGGFDYLGPGGGVDYCLLTMNLDVGERQAAVAFATCSALADGSGVEAVIWRGRVVQVTTPAGTVGTFVHPSVGIYVGLSRSLALLGFAFFVVLIHVDIVNHRAAWQVRHHVNRRLRRSTSRPGFNESSAGRKL